jgi:hypothetical protein
MNLDQCADVSSKRISLRWRAGELDSEKQQQRSAGSAPPDIEVHHAYGKKGPKQPEPGALRI